MVLMKRWSIIRCRMSTLLILQFTTDNKLFLKSILVFDIYTYTKAEILIDWLRRRVV